MSESNPLSPCPMCRREVDEQTACGAVNCPCFPAKEIPAFHRCDNCCAEYGEGMDFGPEIPHFWERVSPGETMPSGECPACGSLCHPISADEQLFDAAADLRDALIDLMQSCANWAPQIDRSRGRAALKRAGAL